MKLIPLRSMSKKYQFQWVVQERLLECASIPWSLLIEEAPNDGLESNYFLMILLDPPKACIEP